MPTIFTPFADELELETIDTEQEGSIENNNEQYASYSPFSSTFEVENSPEGEFESDPEAQQYFEMLNELHDTEFESAIDNLVTELQEHLISYEASSPFLNEAQSLQLATNYLQPILSESNQIFEAMAAELEALPLNQMNEMELETAMDAVYTNRVSHFTPAQEFFFKKLLNKAKTVIKKVIKVAGKLSPTHIIFKKLAKFVQPLLKRVLDKALDKLPASIRPIARQLADKLFKKKNENVVGVEGMEGTEGVENDDAAENKTNNDDTSGEESFIGDAGETPTTYPSQSIQAEFDHYVSQLTQTDSEVKHQQLLAEYEQSTEMEYEDQLQEIETARAQFINELENLNEGEDPTPALENFIPVVIKTAMKVLKIGIKIIGRDKVVKFLAGLMAKWIGKYIGEEKALKLSMVVADKGLKLLKLESPEQENNTRLVYEAIANTVEEVANKISSLSDEVINNQELLTHEAYTAFETAAAAYFPDNTIKYEARESETGNGFWQSKGKYLKHTKTFETTLNNNQLKNIKTFGGTDLLGFATDGLGLRTNAPLKAKIHLYQARKGTTISGIALQEKNVPGLGKASRTAYNQIHPLTKDAAAILLGQPDLGKNVRSILNRNRNLIFEGERFYFLQFAGEPMQTAITEDTGLSSANQSNTNNNSNVTPIDVVPVGRSTQIRRIVSGSLRSGLIIKDIIYFSENDSRKIVEGLKQQSFGDLYEYLKTLKPGFEKNFFGDKHKIGGIILKGLVETAGRIIKEKLSKTLLEKMKHHVTDFEKAVNDPKHGVTLVIDYRISLAKGKQFKLRLQEALSTVTIHIIPGYTQRSSPSIGGICGQCSNMIMNNNAKQQMGSPLSTGNRVAVIRAKSN